MTTTPLTVAEAEAELRTAQATFQDFDRRLQEGDATVTLKDYEGAKVAVEFAAKRVEGARTREAREAEQQKHAAAQKVQADMRAAYAKTLPKIVNAHGRLLSALDALAQAVRAQNETRQDFHARAHALSPEAVEGGGVSQIVKTATDLGPGHPVPVVKLLPLVEAAIFQTFIPDHVEDMSFDERERVRSYEGPPVEAVREVHRLAEVLAPNDAPDDDSHA